MKKIKILATLPLIAGVVFIGSGAVTGATSGINLPDEQRGDIVASGTYKPALTKLDGHIKLVATGTTTKTLVQLGVGCGNAHMNWDDSPAGSAYRVTYRSSWNAPGNCAEFVNGTVDMTFWAPTGYRNNYYNVPDGATQQNFSDFIGNATTKFQWMAEVTYLNADYYEPHCAYLTPGGGFWDLSSYCSV